MIKKIPVDQLKIGMYIHDLNCNWMNHPFALNRFLVDDDNTLSRIFGTGVSEVYIDTVRGIDVLDVEESKDGADELDESLADLIDFSPNIIVKLSPVEEFNHANTLYKNANELMQELMKGARFGKQISLKQFEPMVNDIIDSMFRFPSALLPLAQMKTVDEYTYQHSVSVSALAVAFGRVLDLPRKDIKDMAIGGLLHDLGKAMIPMRIVNKPEKLSGEEFHIMKSHVLYTTKLLKDMKGISEITFNAAAQHHERYDGTGYPNGLTGDVISLHGKMLAIVDVYDATTSLRAYQKPMAPTSALKKLLESGDAQFDSKLVQAFIKGIGVYPAGSLVRMKSERLGIVREVVHDKLLQPIVQVIYDCQKSCYIKPEIVDLSASNDQIKSHESFIKWGIDQASWATSYGRLLMQ